MTEAEQLKQQLVDCIRILERSYIIGYNGYASIRVGGNSMLINYLEEKAHRQYMALQIGTPYSFTEEEAAICGKKLGTESLFKRNWDHFHAKLDAEMS